MVTRELRWGKKCIIFSSVHPRFRNALSPKRSIKTSNEPAIKRAANPLGNVHARASFFFFPQTRQTPLEFRYSNHGRLRFYADDRPLNRRKRGTVRPLPLQITFHIVSRRVLKKNFVKRVCWS